MGNTAFSEEISQRWQAVAALCPTWPVRNLNLEPPTPETNALPLDQLADLSNTAATIDNYRYVEPRFIYESGYGSLYKQKKKVMPIIIVLSKIVSSFFYVKSVKKKQKL